MEVWDGHGTIPGDHHKWLKRNVRARVGAMFAGTGDGEFMVDLERGVALKSDTCRHISLLANLGHWPELYFVCRSIRCCQSSEVVSARSTQTG